MSQEPLQVPPKIQPGELPEEITETLYRTDDPPTIVREPQPDPEFPNPGRYEKRAKPKRAQPQPLPTNLILMLCLLLGFIGGFLGNLAARLF